MVAARLDLLQALKGQIAAGTWHNPATERYPTVVLGSSAARLLGLDRPGQQVFIAGQWFTITGKAHLGFDGHPTRIYTRSVPESVAAVRDVLARTTNPQNPDAVNTT